MYHERDVVFGANISRPWAELFSACPNSQFVGLRGFRFESWRVERGTYLLDNNMED